MTDPILAAVAARAEELFALVNAKQAHPADVMAVLVADTLALSMEDAVSPDTADALLHMASTWALDRRHSLQAHVMLAESPVPEDVSELLRDDGPEV